REAAERFDSPGILGGVDLAGHQNHRLRRQLFAEALELFDEGLEIVNRVAAGVGNVHKVDQHPRSLDVAEELNAKAFPLVGAFDQTRNVGNHKCAVIRQFDDSEIWLESIERIISDLRAGGRNTGDQRRFSGVRVTYEPDIGQQLQLETEAAEIAGTARFMFRWRLMGSSGEPGIAASAASAAGDDPCLAIVGEVKQLFSGFVIEDGGSDRHRDGDAFAVVPGSIAAFAVPAALGRVFGIESEMQEGVAMDGGDHGDIA